MIRLWPRTITIDEDGLRNPISLSRATLVPSTIFAEKQFVYSRDEPVDEGDEKLDKDGVQTTAEELADAPRKYAVDFIVSHAGEGDNFRYVMSSYGYAPADDMVEPPEYIPEYSVTRYWRRMKTTYILRQPRARAHSKRTWKVQK